MIERIHLTVLREIELQGSLTAAAGKLHLTQSALSHTMKKFEAQVGTRLWTKEGRNLQLTEAGRYLLKEAKRLLPQLERLDDALGQFAKGERGSLRIGMECHPCYQWLLTIVGEFLAVSPGVEVDVKQRFQFGGMAALFNHEIDLLVTPDPLQRKGICFTPVFDYEQVLVVSRNHALAGHTYVQPEDLSDQCLYTYPVEIERLDIYRLFLQPENCVPARRKTVEATEIMLQLVSAGRGVACLPRWLVEQFAGQFAVVPISLGCAGVSKQIHLGMRASENESSHAAGLLRLALART